MTMPSSPLKRLSNSLLLADEKAFVAWMVERRGEDPIRLASRFRRFQTMVANKDIRDDRVIWFFDLPKGSSKTFRMKMHASYLGEFTLPAIKCEAMYDPHIVANTASGTAKVTE